MVLDFPLTIECFCTILKKQMKLLPSGKQLEANYYGRYIRDLTTANGWLIEFPPLWEGVLFSATKQVGRYLA
jgi:hypothetical protein